jgi:hypothetical protein
MKPHIGITSKLFDFAGHFIFRPDPIRTRTSAISRRISRTATLDGGATIVDNGYTPSDATFELVPDIETKELIDGLKRLVMLHSEIIVSTADGVFLGAVSNVDETNKIKLTFLVKSKISE